MPPVYHHSNSPYSKLSYVHRGKKVFRFVRAGCVEEVKSRLAAYKMSRG